MKPYLYLLPVFIMLISGCVDEADNIHFPEGEVDGLRPIYGDAETLRDIQVEAPRKLARPGKIYRKNGFLYINEISEGVHVINNTDPSEPVPVAFISIPGNVDIAAKGNIFYFDNFKDLIAVTVSNNGEIEVLKRIENVFPQANNFPPGNDVYFECVDESKGVVVGWEEATLVNPKCYR